MCVVTLFLNFFDCSSYVHTHTRRTDASDLRPVRSQTEFVSCSLHGRDTRRARSSHARQLPRFLVLTRVTPTPRWRRRRRRRPYVNSSVSRAHTCSRSATHVLRERTASVIYVHACSNNGPRYRRARVTTQRYRASPSGSVVMAALETPYATQAREDTAFHELLPFPCLSFSL